MVWSIPWAVLYCCNKKVIFLPTHNLHTCVHSENELHIGQDLFSFLRKCQSVLEVLTQHLKLFEWYWNLEGLKNSNWLWVLILKTNLNPNVLYTNNLFTLKISYIFFFQKEFVHFLLKNAVLIWALLLGSLNAFLQNLQLFGPRSIPRPEPDTASFTNKTKNTDCFILSLPP